MTKKNLNELFKVGDKVESPKSLWFGDIGTVFGVVDNLVHVIFPENSKHYAYQQTFINGENLYKSKK